MSLQFYHANPSHPTNLVIDQQQILKFVSNSSYHFVALKTGMVYYSEISCQDKFNTFSPFEGQVIDIYLNEYLVVVGHDNDDYSVKIFKPEDLKLKNTEKIFKCTQARISQNNQLLALIYDDSITVLNLKQQFLKLKNSISLSIKNATIVEFVGQEKLFVQTDGIQQLVNFSISQSTQSVLNLNQFFKMEQYVRVQFFNNQLFCLSINFIDQIDVLNQQISKKQIFSEFETTNIQLTNNYLALINDQKISIFDENLILIQNLPFGLISSFQDKLYVLKPQTLEIQCLNLLDNDKISTLYIKNNYYDQAIKYSKNPSIYVQIGTNFLLKNNVPEALKNYKFAIAKNIKVGIIIQQIIIQEKFSFLQQLLESLNSNDPQLIDLLLNTYLKNQEDAKFIQKIRQLEKSQNRNFDYQNIANLCRNMPQFSFLTVEIEVILGDVIVAVGMLLENKKVDLVLDFVQVLPIDDLVKVIFEHGKEILEKCSESGCEVLQGVVSSIFGSYTPKEMTTLQKYVNDNFWVSLYAPTPQTSAQPIKAVELLKIFDHKKQFLLPVFSTIYNKTVQSSTIQLPFSAIYYYFQILIDQNLKSTIYGKLQALSLITALDYHALLLLFTEFDVENSVIFCLRKLKFDRILAKKLAESKQIDDFMDIYSDEMRLEMGVLAAQNSFLGEFAEKFEMNAREVIQCVEGCQCGILVQEVENQLFEVLGEGGKIEVDFFEE